MRRPLRLLLLAALLVVPATSGAATIVLDPMTSAFPPNPCLPVSQQPVVFIGSYCDGVTCPPGAVVGSCFGSDLAASTITGGYREARLQSLNGPGPIPNCNARIVAGDGRVRFECSGSIRYAALSLAYSSFEQLLDLTASGMSEMRISVEGSMTAQMPLQCYVLMQAYPGGPVRYATAVSQVTAPGDLVFPFSSFQTDPGFGFDDVGYVFVKFGDCGPGGCTNSKPIPDFAAGNIRFEGFPTGVTGQTWGRLKTLYR